MWYGAQGVLTGAMTAGAALAVRALRRLRRERPRPTLRSLWGTRPGRGRRRASRRDPGSRAGHRDAGRSPCLPRPARGEVAFDAVRFAYPTRTERSSLDGISFTSGPASGSPSSGRRGPARPPCCKLLLRFYDPQSGTVRVDGVDIARGRSRGPARAPLPGSAGSDGVFGTVSREHLLWAPDRRRRPRCGARRSSPTRMGSSGPCRRATPPRSASAA